MKQLTPMGLVKILAQVTAIMVIPMVGGAVAGLLIDMITTDRGLAGSLNANAIRASLRWVQDRIASVPVGSARRWARTCATPRVP